MNYYIYEITNNINGKKYIGKRVTKKEISIDDYMGSGKELIKDLKWYGLMNFKKEILYQCKTEDEAFKIERLCIKLVKADEKDEYYNIASGGRGVYAKGTSMPIKTANKIRSKVDIKRLSQINSGANNWRAKKVRLVNTDEVFETMTQASKKYGIPVSYISNNCRNDNYSGGVLPNGERAIWNIVIDLSELEI